MYPPDPALTQKELACNALQMLYNVMKYNQANYSFALHVFMKASLFFWKINS